MRDFLDKLWIKIKEPILELTAHLTLSIFAIAAVWLTEAALEAVHLDSRMLPVVGVSLSDWLFDLDVVAISLILLVGLVRALRELW